MCTLKTIATLEKIVFELVIIDNVVSLNRLIKDLIICYIQRLHLTKLIYLLLSTILREDISFMSCNVMLSNMLKMLIGFSHMPLLSFINISGSSQFPTISLQKLITEKLIRTVNSYLFLFSL